MAGRNVRLWTERKARALTDGCTLDFPVQRAHHVASGSLSSTRHEHLLQALVEVSTKSGQLQSQRFQRLVSGVSGPANLNVPGIPG